MNQTDSYHIVKTGNKLATPMQFVNRKSAEGWAVRHRAEHDKNIGELQVIEVKIFTQETILVRV